MRAEILPQEADITHTVDIVNPDPIHAVSTDSVVPNDTIQPVNMSYSAESSCNVYPRLVSTEKSVFGTCALALSPLQVEGGVSMDRNRNSASQNCFVDTCTGSTDNDCYW